MLNLITLQVWRTSSSLHPVLPLPGSNCQHVALETGERAQMKDTWTAADRNAMRLQSWMPLMEQDPIQHSLTKEFLSSQGKWHLIRDPSAMPRAGEPCREITANGKAQFAQAELSGPASATCTISSMPSVLSQAFSANGRRMIWMR